MWQAWINVATNQGAPGVDGVFIDSVKAEGYEGVMSFLDELSAAVKDQSYRPQPLRRVNIPKAGKSGQTGPLRRTRPTTSRTKWRTLCST
jgi:retron-type reverse transcriptase